MYFVAKVQSELRGMTTFTDISNIRYQDCVREMAETTSRIHGRCALPKFLRHFPEWRYHAEENGHARDRLATTQEIRAGYYSRRVIE